MTTTNDLRNKNNQPNPYFFIQCELLSTSSDQIKNINDANTLAKGMNPIILPPAMGK